MDAGQTIQLQLSAITEATVCVANASAIPDPIQMRLFLENIVNATISLATDMMENCVRDLIMVPVIVENANALPNMMSLVTLLVSVWLPMQLVSRPMGNI